MEQLTYKGKRLKVYTLETWQAGEGCNMDYKLSGYVGPIKVRKYEPMVPTEQLKVIDEYYSYISFEDTQKVAEAQKAAYDMLFEKAYRGLIHVFEAQLQRSANPEYLLRIETEKIERLLFPEKMRTGFIANARPDEEIPYDASHIDYMRDKYRSLVKGRGRDYSIITPSTIPNFPQYYSIHSFPFEIQSEAYGKYLPWLKAYNLKPDQESKPTRPTFAKLFYTEAHQKGAISLIMHPEAGLLEIDGRVIGTAKYWNAAWQVLNKAECFKPTYKGREINGKDFQLAFQDEFKFKVNEQVFREGYSRADSRLIDKLTLLLKPDFKASLI